MVVWCSDVCLCADNRQLTGWIDGELACLLFTLVTNITIKRAIFLTLLLQLPVPAKS
jgi:hypothetical protein